MVGGAHPERSLWRWAGSGFGPLPLLLVMMTVTRALAQVLSPA